jgi:hypothetical protein
MTTKKRLKEDIESLGYELVATKARLEKSRQAAYKAKQEADKAEQRLRSMQLGIAIGEAIGEGYIICTDASIRNDVDYMDVTSEWDYNRRSLPGQVRTTAELTFTGTPQSLVNFCKVMMGR